MQSFEVLEKTLKKFPFFYFLFFKQSATRFRCVCEPSLLPDLYSPPVALNLLQHSDSSLQIDPLQCSLSNSLTSFTITVHPWWQIQTTYNLRSSNADLLSIFTPEGIAVLIRSVFYMKILAYCVLSVNIQKKKKEPNNKFLLHYTI